MTRHRSITGFALVAALALPLSAAAQAQKPAAPAVKQPGEPPASAPAQKPARRPPTRRRSRPRPRRRPRRPAGAASRPAPAQDGYSYRAEGRRDPFVSLLNRGSDPRAARKAEGLAGLLAADAVLKGILQSRGMYLAIVQGPNEKRQLIVRPNDRFADGVVKAITADSMLILQEVNDPLSLTKQREIRKTLRAVEEVK